MEASADKYSESTDTKADGPEREKPDVDASVEKANSTVEIDKSSASPITYKIKKSEEAEAAVDDKVQIVEQVDGIYGNYAHFNIVPILLITSSLTGLNVFVLLFPISLLQCITEILGVLIPNG